VRRGCSRRSGRAAGGSQGHSSNIGPPHKVAPAPDRTGGSVQGVTSEEPLLDDPLTDAELTALALGTNTLEPLSDDAEQMMGPLVIGGGALPLWYMPPVVRRAQRRWAAPAVIAVVAAFLLIDAMGLCNTYGLLSL
jgi:hypothetical protein